MSRSLAEHLAAAPADVRRRIMDDLYADPPASVDEGLTRIAEGLGAEHGGAQWLTDMEGKLWHRHRPEEGS
jgi:hypothetical protein